MIQKSDMEEFSQHICGHFFESDEERFYRKLAWEYHYRTEDYDQTVCTLRRGKIAMPMNFEQAALCTENADKVRAELTKNFNLEELKKFKDAVSNTAYLFEQEYEPKK